MPKVEAVIEVPRGSFLKRGWDGTVDFVSPFPCPFNYGAIPEYIGCEGDLPDAVVLGPRLPRGKILSVIARGAVGLTDRGMYDDKFVCSNRPLRVWQRHLVLIFFHMNGLSPSIRKYDDVFTQTSAELSRGPQDLVLSKQLQQLGQKLYVTVIANRST